MLSVLFLIALVFAIGYLAVTRRPDWTKRWFRRFWAVRSVLFALFWLTLGFFAIASGVFPLVLFGMAIYLVAALYILVENPQEQVKAWMR